MRFTSVECDIDIRDAERIRNSERQGEGVRERKRERERDNLMNVASRKDDFWLLVYAYDNRRIIFETRTLMVTERLSLISMS